MNDKKQEWIPWALRRTNPDMFYFKDDGITPNSSLPVLIYRGLFQDDYECCEKWLEEKFLSNSWSRGCKNARHDFYHYHSNTHEVLGICDGEGRIEIGGNNGIRTEMHKGDVIVIPAGVGHRFYDLNADFAVVAAYPDNIIPDLKKGTIEERGEAIQNISNIKPPKLDPILGDEKVGLLKFWN